MFVDFYYCYINSYISVETVPCYEAQTGLKLEILKLLNIGIASLCRHAQLFAFLCIFGAMALLFYY